MSGSDALRRDLQEVGPWGQAVALAFRFLFFMVCLIAAGWFVSNFHQIPADSQAVVMRFGAVARVKGPGLLLAWPRPIEQVSILPGAARQIELPVRRFDDGQYLASDPSFSSDRTARNYFLNSDELLNSGFLLTGDSNIVHLDARLFYQITDPADYMVAADHVAAALERLFIASAIATVAGRDLDSILVARPEIASLGDEVAARERLRGDLQRAVNARLDALAARGAGLGVAVSRVDLVPDISAEAKRSFDNVLVVSQDADTSVAHARTLAQYATQDASSRKDRITTDAAAAAEETVSEAKAQTASIAALGKQSQDMSRSMLMTRLYYDRVKPLLKAAGTVEVLDRNSTVRAILPEATGANR